MRKIIKKYSNGKITVIWQPDLCVHAGICFTELPDVFDPSDRPWINMKKATTNEIIDVVEACPTDALTFIYNEPEAIKNTESETNYDVVMIQVITDGPYVVKGKFELTDGAGNIIFSEGETKLCRCGTSKTKPFCDGSHLKIKFSDESDYS